MEVHLSSKDRPPQLAAPRQGSAVLNLAVCWAAFPHPSNLYLVTHPPLHQATDFFCQQQWTLTQLGLREIATNSMTAWFFVTRISHTCIDVCMHPCAYCMHKHTYTQTNIHAHKHTHKPHKSFLSCKHTHTHTHTHLHVHTHTHKC